VAYERVKPAYLQNIIRMTQEDDGIIRAQQSVWREVRSAFCSENQKKRDHAGYKDRIKKGALTKGLHNINSN
jgi:hypothetical protein